MKADEHYTALSIRWIDADKGGWFVEFNITPEPGVRFEGRVPERGEILDALRSTHLPVIMVDVIYAVCQQFRQTQKSDTPVDKAQQVE